MVKNVKTKKNFKKIMIMKSKQTNKTCKMDACRNTAAQLETLISQNKDKPFSIGEYLLG